VNSTEGHKVKLEFVIGFAVWNMHQWKRPKQVLHVKH